MNEIKNFTIEEANKTLPYVKNIVRDILVTGTISRDLSLDPAKSKQNSLQIEKLAERINSLIEELESIGCYYKDWSFNVGLVDFPAMIDGNKVLLCWRSDEDEVKYYHDYSSGYAGRKLILEELIHSKIL
ncbi:MAG: DUF2203 family protein [Ignavibacteriales bacterium]|nr:MAG: DUF2203 family protein [Ignavibacteriales bacterium]